MAAVSTGIHDHTCLCRNICGVSYRIIVLVKKYGWTADNLVGACCAFARIFNPLGSSETPAAENNALRRRLRMRKAQDGSAIYPAKTCL
jgi:hypothetical protein